MMTDQKHTDNHWHTYSLITSLIPPAALALLGLQVHVALPDFLAKTATYTLLATPLFCAIAIITGAKSSKKPALGLIFGITSAVIYAAIVLFILIAGIPAH